MKKKRPRTWDKSEKGKEWTKRYVADWQRRNPEKVLRYQRKWRKGYLAKAEKRAREIFLKAHRAKIKNYERTNNKK